MSCVTWCCLVQCGIMSSVVGCGLVCFNVV